MKNKTKDLIAFCLIEGILLYGLTIMGTHLGSVAYKNSAHSRGKQYNIHSQLEDKQAAEKYRVISKKLRNISNTLNPFAYI